MVEIYIYTTVNEGHETVGDTNRSWFTVAELMVFQVSK